MKKPLFAAGTAFLLVTLGPSAQAQETAFSAARRANLEELKNIFASAAPLGFTQMPSARKSGMCKSLFEGDKLVVGPSAFISTKDALGTRFGDYGHSSYPDKWDTGSEELYDQIQAQAENIVWAVADKAQNDHRLLAKAFPDNKALRSSLTVNEMLLRQPKLDELYQTDYPLQHPSLSRGKAVAYPVAGAFVGRVEYRQTADGLVIAGIQPSVEMKQYPKARRLESMFKGSAPTMFCFWYEEVNELTE